MARVQEIRGMAEWYATDIASSPADWMKYLDTAADYTVIPLLTSFSSMHSVHRQPHVHPWNCGMRR